MDFRNWKRRKIHRGKVFVSDGIIDRDRYYSSDRKLLFLFEEVYDDDAQSSWDLCGLIRDCWKGPRYSMWWQAACWAYACQHASMRKIPVFPHNGDLIEDCREYLLSSAVVNIKKSAGQEQSLTDNLSSYVRSDGDLLERQVREIDPDLILCGGSLVFFEQFWPSEIESCTDLLYVTEGIPVVDFYNPAAQYPHELTFYTLASVVHHAVNKGLL